MIDGEVSSYDQMERIVAVADGLAPTVKIHNLTLLSETGRRDLINRMETDIGSPKIHVALRGNYLYLEGIAPNDFEADRAAEIAKTFVIGSAKFRSRQPAGKKRCADSVPDSVPDSDGSMSGAGLVEEMPIGYNRNGLPVTIVDMLRVDMSRRPAREPRGKTLPSK